jgi:hypothetical protein
MNLRRSSIDYVPTDKLDEDQSSKSKLVEKASIDVADVLT